MSLDWPLVGRRADREYLSEAWWEGRADAVFVTGAAGVGKSRLIAEVSDGLSARGVTVLPAATTQAAASIPFGAVAHLLPEAGPTNRDGEAIAVPETLLERAEHALRERAGGRRLVLVIDDVHLLDDTAAVLVHRLVTAKAAFLCATLPVGERLPAQLRALGRPDTAGRVELAALTGPQVAHLLAQVLRGEVETETADRFHQWSAGNPLHLRELVQQSRFSGALSRADGRWRLEAPAAALPAGFSLGRLILDRLDTMDPEARGVVELVAFGEPIGRKLLARSVPTEAVDAAQLSGMIQLVVDDQRQTLRMAHPLLGRMLRVATSADRARELCAHLADLLATTGLRRHGDVLRLVNWRLAAGRRSAVPQLLTAARQAATGQDHHLSGRLALAAYTAGGGFAALRLAAQARAALLDPGTDRLLAELARTARTPAQHGEAGYLRALHLLAAGDNPDAALAAVTAAETAVRDAQVPAGPRDQAELVAARIQVEEYTGQTTRALRLARTALAATPHTELELDQPPTPEPVVDPAAGLSQIDLHAAAPHLLLAYLTALVSAGRPVTARLVADAVAPRFALAGEPPWLRNAFQYANYRIRLLGGDLDGAAALVDDGYRRAVQCRSERAVWAYARGELGLATGEAGTAAWLREAASLLRGHGTLLGTRGTADALGHLAEDATVRGEPAEAARALAELDGRTPFRGFAPSWQLGRAWLLAARGELPAARQLAVDLARQAEELGAYAHAVRALHTVVRLGGAAGALDQLTALARRLEGPLPGLYADQARALAGGGQGARAAVALRFRQLGAERFAAETERGGVAFPAGPGELTAG